MISINAADKAEVLRFVALFTVTHYKPKHFGPEQTFLPEMRDEIMADLAVAIEAVHPEIRALLEEVEDVGDVDGPVLALKPAPNLKPALWSIFPAVLSIKRVTRKYTTQEPGIYGLQAIFYIGRLTNVTPFQLAGLDIQATGYDVNNGMVDMTVEGPKPRLQRFLDVLAKNEVHHAHA